MKLSVKIVCGGDKKKMGDMEFGYRRGLRHL